MRDVGSGLSAMLGGGYVNYFVLEGRAYKVIPQVEDRFRASRELLDTYYLRAASGDLVPDLRAAAAVIYDPGTRHVLWEENSSDQRSIASITKVMTATVFLEGQPDLTEPVTIVRLQVRPARARRTLISTRRSAREERG